MIRSGDAPGPSLLVGEATEDWTGDALFYEYSTAVDPLHVGAIDPVPIRRFSPEIHRGGPTRLVPLDLSEDLGVGYPATSPGLLASFVVIRPGDQLATGADSTSELYYCIRGRGRSQIERSIGTAGPSRATMAWAEGDFWTLPAGCAAVHAADPADPADPAETEGALLYRVTDAPLLSYLGVRPHAERFPPPDSTGRRPGPDWPRWSETRRPSDAAG